MCLISISKIATSLFLKYFDEKNCAFHIAFHIYFFFKKQPALQGFFWCSQFPFPWLIYKNIWIKSGGKHIWRLRSFRYLFEICFAFKEWLINNSLKIIFPLIVLSNYWNAFLSIKERNNILNRWIKLTNLLTISLLST